MSAHVSSFLVTLADDVTEEQSEALVQALHQLRGVVDVAPNTVDATDHIARVQARTELTTQLLAVLRKPERLPNG